MKKLISVIFIIYSGYIICQDNPDEFNYSYSPSKYIDVTDDNLFIYVLNDKGILLLEKGLFDLLTLSDEYKHGFTLQAIISVTENKLIVHDRDTLFIFTIIPPGKIQFEYKQKSPLVIEEIRRFGERFIVRSNNLLNILSVDSDSVRVILETEIPWLRNKFDAVYPYIYYISSQPSIRSYKYNTSYNQVYLYYLFSDMASLVTATEEYILYYYYLYRGTVFPPICHIKKMNSNYPFFNLISTTDCQIPIDMDGFKATKNFVYYDKILRRISNFTTLYTHTNTQKKLFFTDYHVYLLGNNFEYTSTISSPLEFKIFDYPTSVENEKTMDNYRLALYQNSPNPFNNRTKIKYIIPGFSVDGINDAGGMASIKIYDLLGNEIRTVVYSYKSPGSYEIDFDAGELSSGIYFYRLIFNGSNKLFYSDTKKMVIMK